MGASLHLLHTLLKVPRWAMRQPRERWLVHRAVTRIRAARGEPVVRGLVVLVTESVGSRICKVGYGLKSLGWRVVLVHRNNLPANAGRCFDEMRRYATPAEALWLAAHFRPVAYHVFANWNFNAAALLIRHQPGKMVFDDYDVLVGTLAEDFSRAYHREIRLERFCLENADGLCCRDLETQCARKAGYSLRGRRLLLLDCCWGGQVESPAPLASRGHGLHIVNCGNIPLATRAEYLVHQQELGALAATLTAQGLAAESIRFHAYPTSSVWRGASRNETGERLAGGAVPAFFHLHDPVPPDELPRVLSQYDAGLYHVGIGANPPTYNRWKFAYTSGNRVFDYLDAGLPVVIHGCKFMEFLVRRAHVDIGIEAPQSVAAHQFLRRENTEALRRNAFLASSRLAITQHIPKLAAFYESL